MHFAGSITSYEARPKKHQASDVNTGHVNLARSSIFFFFSSIFSLFLDFREASKLSIGFNSAPSLDVRPVVWGR